MESNNNCKMLSFFFINLLIASKSLQIMDDDNARENCDCYKQCQNNFTTNSVNDEQVTAACERGCRFYSLVSHSSSDSDVPDNFSAKEGCLMSCSDSYINQKEVTACYFGCSFVKPTDSCDPMEHNLPQFTYLLVEESDVLIHSGDPDPDDVLIDPGLRKQFERTLETLLDSIPKIPEIHFRNLPVSKDDVQTDNRRITFRCPGLNPFNLKPKLGFNKMTAGGLFFWSSVFMTFAMICFIISSILLMTVLPTKPTLKKMKENIRNVLHRKRIADPGSEDERSTKFPMQGSEEAGDVDENIGEKRKLEGATLAFNCNENNHPGGKWSGKNDVQNILNI